VTRWPHQDFALAEVPRRIDAGERRVLLTSPTGGGKSRIACDLIEWAVGRGWPVVLYTNRRLLIDQLARVLTDHGITFGVRAATWEDCRERQVQISSLPTENHRVLKSERWTIHGHGERVLALVDEAHLNKADTAATVLGMHLEHGGAYVGITATPVGLGHLYDSLVVAGTPTELRRCGALVPAYHYGIDEPDMRDFKQSVKTGEYAEGDLRKAVMTKNVFGRVLEHYRALNAEGRPTILFAPGVPESIWFAEQLTAAGVSAAHIDGTGVWWDGEYTKGGDREALLDAVRCGDVQVLCNRFVLREGLDLKEVSHLILATVMGSLQTYLQSVGRGLRSCKGKDRLTIQDHGGHWWRHGSANADREWNLAYTETIVAGLRQQQFTEQRDPEPITCPQCRMVRAAGSRCPQCGFESQRKTRMVVQQDGRLVEHEGDVFKPRKVRVKPDTMKVWEQCYYRAKRSKNRMTFRQAEGLFFYENHYWPPHDLPLMPTNRLDWFLPVAEVPAERLSA
jgi:DNA repair protein RadD